MKHAYCAAAAALTLALGGSALAESNAPAAVEMPRAANIIRAGGLGRDVGSEALPAFAGASVPVVAGTGLVLVGNGSEAAVQTANSLPAGSLQGTVAYAQAQSVARFLAERAGQQAQTRLAASPRQSSPFQG